MKTRALVLVSVIATVAACAHGTGAAHPTPVATADGAIREFLAAASDSNIARMANIWGTANGPASVTGQPAQWQTRLKVMQVYLKGGTWTVIDNKPQQGNENRRDILMQFTRGTCVKNVPFVAVKSSHGGWLVESVDLTAAGNPVTPCPAPGAPNVPSGTNP